MSSKGSRVYTLRLEPYLEERLHEAIERNNRRRFEVPWNLSDWIRDAILEKLAHQSRAHVQQMKRSLSRRRRRELATLAGLQTDQAGEAAPPAEGRAEGHGLGRRTPR